MLNHKKHAPAYNIQLKTLLLLFVSVFFISGVRPGGVWAQSLAENKHNDINPAIKFYQKHISGIDGDRCPMYPHCSGYSAQAIQKHGFLVGWIMSCDRLLRCGRDEVRLSPHIKINGRKLTFDPVSANDFWWFSPKPSSISTEVPTKSQVQSDTGLMPDMNADHQR
jgi:hypothetical protein